MPSPAIPALVVLSVLLSFCQGGVACGGGESETVPVRGGPAGSLERNDRVPHEYIVQLKDTNAEFEVLPVLFDGYSVKLKRKMGPGQFLIHVAPDPGPVLVKKIAAAESAIRYAEPNAIYRTQTGGAAGVAPGLRRD